MDFFEDLFIGDDKETSSPKISYKKLTEPAKTRNPRGRDPRALGINDFELKNKQTTAGKGMDTLKQSGNLDPAQIEKIASNLQGQGAKRKDLIDDLIDEIKKGNAIDSASLSEEQKNELRERMQQPEKSREKDFKSGQFGDSFSDDPKLSDDTSYIPPPPPLPKDDTPPPQHTRGGYLGDAIEPPQHTRGGYLGDAIPNTAPTTTDPAELEHSITVTPATSLQTDPMIEQGKENSPDATIFRQMIHVGAELSFDYLKQLSGYGGAIDSAQAMAKKFLGFQFTDLVDLAVDSLQKNKLSDVGSLRGTTPDRIKLQMKDAELGEHSIIKNACLYPLLAVAFKLYLVDRGIEFGYMGDTVFRHGFKHLLEKYVKLQDSNVRYFMYCWDNSPKSLLDAYERNRDAITSVTPEERQQIMNYHTNIMLEYDRIFAPNKFMVDVKRYEHGGTELNQMLINLANPIFLFEISKVFSGIDEFILNVRDNEGLLLGLMGLLYAKALKDGTNMGDALLANARVDGIVYYTKQTEAPKFKNLEIDLLRDAKEEVEEKIIDGTSYIIFKGTDAKQDKFLERDFMKNIINLAGSSELFSNEAFNNRIVKATEIIEKREREGVPIKIIGYSLGGIFGLYMSSIYPTIPTRIYSPILANNEETTQLMDGIEQQNSNLEINYIEGDPISVNVKKYEDRLNIKKQKKSRFFDSHSLNNYLFNP